MVLRLSVNTFHYKAVKYVLGEEYFLYRINLCKYFWSVVFSMLVIPIIVPIRTVVALTYNMKWPKVQWPTVNIPREKRKRIIFFVQVTWTGVMIGFMYNDFTSRQYFWIPVLSFALGVLWSSQLFGKRFADWELERARRRRQRPVKVPKPKEPNLAWEYVKARKARICPYIVWENR
jgi:hypothetical protein